MDLVPCQSSAPVSHEVTLTCTESFMIGACSLMQTRWCPQSLSPSFISPLSLESYLLWLTSLPTLLTHFCSLPPLQTNGQWSIKREPQWCFITVTEAITKAVSQCPCKNLNIGVHICNPSTGKEDIGRLLELADQPAWSNKWALLALSWSKHHILMFDHA